ncbi:NAD(P)-bd-dom domain-containing protein [Fusarium keratoplasticum]|nr:NAD(P)-bd-dom domain-containing protein [Fusarium keratoplasticum]
MVNVAVLGGSGHVGKTIVDALKEHPSHTVIVLGRQAPPTVDPEAPTVLVQYDDEESLKSALETHEIDTVISCLGVHNDELAEVEAAVIRASDRSKHTKRFIPSNWSLPNADSSKEPLNPWAVFQRKALDLLRTTGLQWTEIAPGYFLDYWGMPYIKTHLTATVPVIDIANAVAAIPGTGDEPVAFSYSFDVAKVVARLLEIPEWQQTTYIIGDKLSWNELLGLAQEARGTEFKVHHDDLEKLKNGQITELPCHVPAYSFFPKEHLQGLYAILEMLMVLGEFDLPSEEAINNQLPDIKMLTAREMLNQTWKAHGGQ